MRRSYHWRKKSIEERLYGRSERQPDGCLLFTGGTDSSGYGSLMYEGRVQGAHLVSYKLSNGDIPTGHKVRHRCDTPPCIEPTHLVLGTHSDNMRDMAARGRASKKLIASDVVYIFLSKEPTSEIASRFGIKDRQVRRIRNRETWKQLFKPREQR